MMAAQNEIVPKSRSVVLAIASGMIALAGSFKVLEFQMGDHDISFIWSIVFPLVIALSMGARCALIAAVPGLTCFLPFVIWPENGWANLPTSIIYTVWLCFHGWGADKRRQKPSTRWNPILLQLIYTPFHILFVYTLFRWSFAFNPAPWSPDAAQLVPINVIHSIAVKSTINFLIIVLLAESIIRINVFRRVIGLPASRFLRRNGLIFFLGVAFALASWIMELLLMNFIFPSTGSMTPLTVSESFLLHGIILMLLALLACNFVSYFMTQQLEAMEVVKTRNLQLEASAERFKQLFDLIPFSCVISDFHGRTLVANQHYCNVTGLTKKEIVGKTPEEMNRYNYSEIREQLVDELKTKGYIKNREVPLRTPEGKVWLIISSCIIDWQGEKAVLTAAVNVTDRKRAEEDLKRSMELLREAGRIAKVGGWTADMANQSVVWSDEMGKIHDKAPGFCPSMEESSRFIAPEWRDKIITAYGHCFSDGLSLDEEFEIITAKGRRRWVRATGEAVINEAGKITRIIGALQDISARKQAEAEKKKLQEHLTQARKMEAIGILAGGIAHDFNNILSGLMGFTDLAMLEAGDNETLKEYLDEVSTSSLRARDLVRHILTFSRKSEVEIHPINITPIIKETLKFIRASLPSNIAMSHSLQIDNGAVLGDATQIHQILMNLFTNASHAMKDRGGTLDVTLDRVILEDTQTGFSGKLSPGNYLHLIVSDTGCGIPKEISTRIFEPFFTTKERGEGTGMGLAIVYGIVKDMGGGISVYSEIGKGTTFRLLFPEHRQAASDQTDDDATLKTGQGNILIVDDEMPIIDSTCELLSRLGYSATGVLDGIKAVEAVKNKPDFYDLVLTDMIMPHLDGIELARQIKEINPDIPIILCTGFSRVVTREEAERAGILDVIMKPMIAREISITVEKAIGRKQRA